MSAKRAISAALALLLAVSVAAPSGVRAHSARGFTYDVSGRSATVTGCVGSCPRFLRIPATLRGYRVTSIGNYAFNNRLLTRVTIPRSVTSIGNFAFYENAFIRITIPNSVTRIGDWAFSSNPVLTRVTIGNSVTSIGDAAFAGTGLTGVTIPRSVMSIGNYAFASNPLTRVLFLGNEPEAGGGDVFMGNLELHEVVRRPSATGWDGTWSGVTVVIAE